MPQLLGKHLNKYKMKIILAANLLYSLCVATIEEICLLKRDNLWKSESFSLKENLESTQNKNYTINDICRQYLLTEACNHKRILTSQKIGYLIRTIYWIRAVVYKRCGGYNPRLQAYICSVCVFIHFYTKLFKNIIKLGYAFELPLDVNANNSIFTTQFPMHAYSLSDCGKNIFNSLGDYLSSEPFGKRNIVSLDEQVRWSRHPKDKTAKCSPENLKRTQVKSRWRLNIFLKNMVCLFRANSASKWLNIIDLIGLNSWCEQRKYVKLLAAYPGAMLLIPPYSNFSTMEIALNRNVVFLFYSENFVNPPFSPRVVSQLAQLKNNDVFKNVNMGIFGGGLNNVGFVKYYNKIYKKYMDYLEINYDFFLESGYENTAIVIGFEESCKLPPTEKPRVIIFDNAPESNYKQYSRSLGGDFSATEDFVDQFLSDILAVCVKHDIEVVLKPKYSIDNYRDTAYGDILFKMSAEFTEHFFIVSPYHQLTSLLDEGAVALSFPFTSTQSFGREFGIQSFFFLPDKYIFLFPEGVQFDEGTITGKKCFERVIAKLVKN